MGIYTWEGIWFKRIEVAHAHLSFIYTDTLFFFHPGFKKSIICVAMRALQISHFRWYLQKTGTCVLTPIKTSIFFSILSISSNALHSSKYQNTHIPGPLFTLAFSKVTFKIPRGRKRCCRHNKTFPNMNFVFKHFPFGSQKFFFYKVCVACADEWYCEGTSARIK